MISKLAYPMLALVPAACSSRPQPLKPIPAVGEQRQCPAFPQAPKRLLVPPAKTDFLSPTA